jgi:hypothetical protein
MDYRGLTMLASKFVGEFTGDITGDKAGVPTTYTIGLAASATTDGMDITVTAKDKDGETLTGVHPFIWYISEADTGIGITADTYSGDVTTVSPSGGELVELVSKKVFLCVTAATGIWTGLAVASANPTDQYVVVINPYTGGLVVSAVSGTNWEGAA